MRRVLVLLLVLAATCLPGLAQSYRAFWADGFHDGYKTPTQVDQLVADARQAGANALFVQVRRRGNSFYLKSLEPPVIESGYSPNFDALADVIAKAHAAGIEVHAWLAVCPVGGDAEMNSDARHILNTHGPAATGRDNWIALGNGGQTLGASGNYWIDPGHPDAAAYTSDVIQNVVENYDVDGIHLDLIRYSELVSGVSAWGYNPVSVERFNRLWQSTGLPVPSNADWAEFRRQQLSALLRRVYLRAVAFRPQIKVTAALIAWGDAPADLTSGSAYSTVMQDWAQWLREGILDIGVPMNYDRESNASQKKWFDNWLSFERANQGIRAIMPGIAAYLNTVDDTLAQARRVLATPANAGPLAGVVFYSYACTNASLCGTGGIVPATNAQFYAAAGSLFASLGPARPPDLDWKLGPSAPGHVLGQILVDGQAGAPLADGMVLEMKPAGTATSAAWPYSAVADGNGHFGFANVGPPAGGYSLIAHYGYGQVVPESNVVQILNGQVTKVVLDVSSAVLNVVRPALAFGGNAASYDNSAVAPGELLALFGQNLADSPRGVSSMPLPTRWSGTQVLVVDGAAPDSAGTAAPILYASPTQVNIQLAFGLKGPHVKILVRAARAESVPINLSLAEAVPGLFADGAGSGLVFNGDWSRNSPANPVHPGDWLITYATGLGEVRETVAAGAAAPNRPVDTTNAATCTIGGREAQVGYAGLAPGFVSGVYQVNIQVPPDAPAGDLVPLKLTVAGRSGSTYAAIR